MLDRMKAKGGEVTDEFVVGLLTHLVSRCETCITSLAIRKIALQDPIANPPVAFNQLAIRTEDVLDLLTQQQKELARYKAKFGDLSD